MLEGMLGDFFPEMGFVVIGTLIFSLIEGVLILPTHIAHSKALKGIKPSDRINKIINKTTDILNRVKTKYYAPVLRFTLKNPLTVCLLYTSPSPRDLSTSRMPSSA